MTPSIHGQSPPAGALYVGIDAGSVSVNGIVIDEQKRIVYESPYSRHFGKVEESVAALIGDLYSRFGRDRITGVAFTGSHGRQLSGQVGAPYEFGIVSQLLGAVHVAPEVRTVISMGGQETALLQVAHRDSGWELENFSTNGPCASGTGSFIDQQAERLATSIYERRSGRERPPIDRILADFIALGLKSRRAASVACRCTVFTKSDMIHLQNKGERLEDIIHGLHVGNARNYISTLVANRVLSVAGSWFPGIARFSAPTVPPSASGKRCSRKAGGRARSAGSSAPSATGWSFWRKPARPTPNARTGAS